MMLGWSEEAEDTSSVRREGSVIIYNAISAPDRHQGLPARSQLMTGHWPVIQDAAHPLGGEGFWQANESDLFQEEAFWQENGQAIPE